MPLPHIISLGAGVQSSTMALMAAHGEIGPMPVGAIFADTQAEPQEVYDWLGWLETQLPFPVERVTGGDLTKETLRVRQVQSDGHQWPKGTNYLNKLIPVFGKDPEGKRVAALGRRCTTDFKIRPIMKAIRKMAKVKRGTKVSSIVQWIGISYDEMERMKVAREPWYEHRWPLIELKMKRNDCLLWMKANGYPEPPRSACYYCPFHTDKEWRRIRDTDKVSWKKAVAFDSELRAKFKLHDKTLNLEVFLHSSLLPLGEANIDGPPKDKNLEFDFAVECDGMCGL